MKKLYLFILLIIVFNTNGLSQQLSPEVQCVVDACMSMRLAIEAGNTTGLREANEKFKNCNICSFSSLQILDANPISLEGHFVYDDKFVDSLIVNRDVYKFAQNYVTIRKAASRCKVNIRNCVVGGSSSSKYSFNARKHQEIVVIAEPKGMLTLRIHDITHDTWYKDTSAENEGKPLRMLVFELPANERSTLEVEVINCSKEDKSFVIISN